VISPHRRVAITGLGVKAPAGCDIETFWETVRKAESVAAPITRFDVSDFRVRFACEVRHFDPSERFDYRTARRMDRVTQLAVAAALDAYEDAEPAVEDPARAGVVFGTGTGGIGTMYEQVKRLIAGGPDKVSPLLVPMTMSNAPPALVSMEVGWTGASLTISTACASSAHAIGHGFRMVATGESDVVLAGGGESGIEIYSLAAFSRMGALSTRNDDPTHASRPFDAARDGYVMAEGAAFLLLEDLDRAEHRGAQIYAEVLGFGQNSDAHHITSPSPDGSGAERCMRAALSSAGLVPEDVGHVNAHGTSTELNDLTEGLALARLFGDRQVPVTASKGVFGHLMGGGGAAEAVVATLSVRDGLVPATANHENLDPHLSIDVVTEERVQERPIVLSNSFGFGGHNASLVFGPAPAA